MPSLTPELQAGSAVQSAHDKNESYVLRSETGAELIKQE